MAGAELHQHLIGVFYVTLAVGQGLTLLLTLMPIVRVMHPVITQRLVHEIRWPEGRQRPREQNIRTDFPRHIEGKQLFQMFFLTGNTTRGLEEVDVIVQEVLLEQIDLTIVR